MNFASDDAFGFLSIVGLPYVRDRFDCKWKTQGNRYKLRWRKIQNAGHFTRRQGFAPDYWAWHPTTGLCTRRLGFAPDDWALHLTTGLFTRLLGFSPDYWAFHPTTGLRTRLLGFAPDYWAFHPTTGYFPDY